MIDIKITLKKLHEQFPNMELDDLFKILDCYTEEWKSTITTFKSYDPNQPLNMAMA